MEYRPPSAERIAALPRDPLRLLVSGCLASIRCTTDGQLCENHDVLADILAHPRVEFVSFCPEDVALGTPREIPDCVGGNGFAVLQGRARVLSESGVDLSEAMIRGCTAMRDKALAAKVDIVITQNISAACGAAVIYEGNRSKKKYQKGPGVATALLLEAGIPVIGVYETRSLELLRAHLGDGYTPKADAQHHHESAWYRDYFGSR